MFLPPGALTFVVFTVGPAFFLGMLYGIRFWHNRPLCNALDELADKLINHHSVLPVDYARAVKCLNVRDRESGIAMLIAMATIGGNNDALLAIRDHITPKDLRNALRLWHADTFFAELFRQGDLRPWIQGDSIAGLQNGQKLVLFGLGKRRHEDLALPISAEDEVRFTEYLTRMNTPVLLRSIA